MEDSSRRRRLLLMTLGLVLALVAGGAAFLLGTQGGGGTPSDEVEMADVLVASGQIEPRTTLTAENVVVRQVPADAVLQQAYREPTAAVGRVNSVAIYAGQQITPNLFASTTAGQSWEIMPADEEITLDSPYWRAVSIPIPRSRAVGGDVFPGQRVDVFVTVELVSDDSGVPVADPVTGELGFPAQAVPIIDPETGRITAVTSGHTTKITFEDLEVLKADAAEGMYIFKVDLHQAEQIAHMLQVGPDGFAMALRPPQDTRDVDTTEYGETNDNIVMTYLYRVPMLIDLEELLGFPINPVGPGFTPPPAPEEPGESPQPEPGESPEPEEPEEP